MTSAMRSSSREIFKAPLGIRLDACVTKNKSGSKLHVLNVYKKYIRIAVYLSG